MLPPELLVICLILTPFLVFTTAAYRACWHAERQSHAATKETLRMVMHGLEAKQ